jgi:hypothetical protein
MFEMEIEHVLEHAVVSKLALGTKAAVASKATMAAGGMRVGLLAGPFGWPIMLVAAAAIGAIVLMDKATNSAVEAASKS